MINERLTGGNWEETNNFRGKANTNIRRQKSS